MRQFKRLFTILGLCGWVALAVVLGLAPNAEAAPRTMHDLVRADRGTLDSLYASGTVGEVPTGSLDGRAIVSPGSRRTAPASVALRPLWQGKVFHADGTGKNRVFGVRAIPIKVHEGVSWHDGGPALVVDYTDSWRPFRGVRDEIREVSPGLFLGRMFVTKNGVAEEKMMFTLHAPNSRRDGR